MCHTDQIIPRLFWYCVNGGERRDLLTQNIHEAVSYRGGGNFIYRRQRHAQLKLPKNCLNYLSETFFGYDTNKFNKLHYFQFTTHCCFSSAG